MDFRIVGLSPEAVWYCEGVLGKGVAHACERLRSIFVKAKELLFLAWCQLSEGPPYIFFRYFFMRLPDDKEWFLPQDQCPSLNMSCGEGTPSLSRRGFQFEWRLAWHLEAMIG